MRTRDEFVRRWRLHIAGLALYGRYSEERDGLATRTARVLEIPAEVEKLLGMLWDDMTRGDETPVSGTPRPTVNGAHNPKR